MHDLLMADPIRYEISSSGIDIAELEEFGRLSEREQPITFGGRSELLELFIAVLGDKKRKPARTNSVFVRGAPGSGKTSLLRRLIDLLGSTETTCVYLEGHHLRNPKVFVSNCVNAYSPKNTAGITETRVRRHESTADLKLVKQSESWERHQPSVLSLLGQGMDVWEVIQNILQPGPQHTFVILIDEAQRLRPDEGSDVNSIAVDLHSGRTCGMSILPIFAGLFDTPAALARVGISRAAHSFIKLGELSLEESEDVVNGFFDDESLGLSGCFSPRIQARVARSFAVASEGWPRHLHHYLQGLAIALAHDMRQQAPDGVIDLNKVLDYGHIARIQYYRDRLESSELSDFGIAIMDVVEGSGNGELEFRNVVKVADENFGIPAQQSREYLARAIHGGVLEPIEPESRAVYRFPIPSFYTHMQNRGELDRTLFELRESYLEHMQSHQKMSQN